MLVIMTTFIAFNNMIFATHNYFCHRVAFLWEGLAAPDGCARDGVSPGVSPGSVGGTGSVLGHRWGRESVHAGRRHDGGRTKPARSDGMFATISTRGELGVAEIPWGVNPWNTTHAQADPQK